MSYSQCFLAVFRCSTAVFFKGPKFNTYKVKYTVSDSQSGGRVSVVWRKTIVVGRRRQIKVNFNIYNCIAHKNIIFKQIPKSNISPVYIFLY